MKSAYRVLAYLTALEVLVQAGAIAYAMAGLGAWIQGGGVLDKAAMESESLDFPGIGGFALHGMNGMMIVPVVAVLLLVVSFFARVRGGVQLAVTVLAMVVVQVTLGIFGHGLPALAWVHGTLAVLLFGVALFAAHRAGTGAEVARTGDRPAAGVV
jgi:hypothetical protein